MGFDVARYGRVATFSLAAIVLLSASACSRHGEDRREAPPVQPQPGAETRPDQPDAAELPAAAPAVRPESSEWSRDDALARLDDESARLSAAVRLARLSNVTPEWLADPLSEEEAARLSLLPLAEKRWALGLTVPGQAGRSLNPLLISGDGSVSPMRDPGEVGPWLLCVSDAPEYFPHVLIGRTRVLLAGEPLQTALVGRKLSGVRFDVHEREGLRRLVLVLTDPLDEHAAAEGAVPGRPDARVVAEYRWDVVEQVFVGPASDKLPDPPGGRFELDVEASVGLLPVGGETPATAPAAPPERKRFDPTTRPQY
jgi:hypothetical protein